MLVETSQRRSLKHMSFLVQLPIAEVYSIRTTEKFIQVIDLQTLVNAAPLTLQLAMLVSSCHPDR